MKVNEFTDLIAGTSRIELKSSRTSELIKTCTAEELTEEDLLLKIRFMYPGVYYNKEHKVHLGSFLLYVTED